MANPLSLAWTDTSPSIHFVERIPMGCVGTLLIGEVCGGPMHPRLIAFLLVSLMLIAPAIGLSESMLEENEVSDSSARSVNHSLLWGAHVAGSGSTDSVM